MAKKDKRNIQAQKNTVVEELVTPMSVSLEENQDTKKTIRFSDLPVGKEKLSQEESMLIFNYIYSPDYIKA